jgi:hypothetical protein
MTTSITSLRNPIDDLTSKLNQPPTKPVKTIEEQLAGQRERGAVAEDVRPQVMKESLGSVETAMQDLQAKRVNGAEDYGTMLEKQAKDTAALEKKYTAMRPEPIEFAPSQQTPEQLQTIAVSMMLIGALAGGSAKRSGIAGLKAMTGMLDGYKQGRKDVFDREKIIFEKALETQKQKIEEVKSLYDSALRAQTAGQTAEANKFKALLEAEIQNGAMLVDVARNRNDAVNKMFDALAQASKTATEQQIAINKGIEDRKLQRDKMAQEAGFKERELGLREREIQRKEAGQPLSATEVNKIQGLDSLSNSLEKQLATFKPEYASLGLFGLGADMSLEAKRRFGEQLGDKLAKETVAWWSKYQQLQAPNRHALYGATLTGNELKNYQSYTSKPSDDPEIVKGFLQDQIAYAKGSARDKREALQSTGYRVPAVNAKDFLETYKGDQETPGAGAKPSSPQQPSQSNYIEDQRAKANEAVANGANRDAVAKRFKERTGQEL